MVAAATPDFPISFVRDYVPLKSIRPAPLSVGYVCDASQTASHNPLAFRQNPGEMRMTRAHFLALVAAGIVVSTAAPVSAKPTAGQKLADAVVVNPQIFSQGDDPYPAQRVAFAGGVTGLPNVVYQSLPRYRPMVMDLYLPPTSFHGPRPTIVFIHGGGWAGGGKRLSGAFDNWPLVLASMALRGYVVAAVSYRFSGEAAVPGAIQDVKASIRWLRANAGKYGVDKDRIVTWGGSAGGQLAALAATSCGVADLAPPSAAGTPRNATVEQLPAGAATPIAESECVQGAVTWYGIFDFTKMPMRESERNYLGCGDTPCTPEQQRRASALTYLGPTSPPMLMITGSADRLVPPEQSVDFHAAMKVLGLNSELMIIQGVDHSFIGTTPQATRDASRAALARTVDFIEQIIGDKRPQAAR
jgi:acetyl esterase/lipase